jgi:hypothetical protein
MDIELRNYFAGQALAGMLAYESLEDRDIHEYAREAYAQADAMLLASCVQPTKEQTRADEYFCWMIERYLQPQVTGRWFKSIRTSDQQIEWTDDPNSASRFPTADAALAYIQSGVFEGHESPVVTEHIFVDGVTPPPKPSENHHDTDQR